MRDIPRVIWVLAAGRFASTAVSFMMIYFFLYLTGPRGLSPGAAGVISGVLGAGALLGNFTGGRFGDRWGHRRAFLGASTVTSGLALSIPWLPTAVLPAVVPALGYLSATAGVAQGALIALAVPPGDRRRSVAITRAAANAGFVIGPIVGAVLVTYSFTAMFVLEGALILAVRMVTARWLPAEPPPASDQGPRPTLWQSLRTDRRLLALLPAIVAVDIVYRQLYSTVPVSLHDRGQPVGLYALLIALGSGMILLLEIPVTITLRHRPSLRIIGIGYGLVGAGFALFGLSAGAWLVVGAMVVLTAGEILYKTTATAHVLDAAPAGLTGQYQGLYTGAATSGTMLAPAIGGAIYGAAPQLLWPGCALLAGLAAAVALILDRRPAAGAGTAPAVAAKVSAIRPGAGQNAN
jgi:MFS family permease